MIWRLVVAAAVVLLAVAVAQLIRSRRRPDAPTQSRRVLPSQIDRADFDGAERQWMAVVFTSDTCSTCADVVAKVEVLKSEHVAVQVASYQRDKKLHSRYEIDAVPAVLLVDALGVVRRTFLGPVTATDLWAALAEVRAES